MRIVLRMLAGLALIYVLLVLIMLALQPRLVYFPGPPPASTPADQGLEYRDLTLQTTDGVALHAWFLPAPDPFGAVLFSHGNAGSIEHRIERARVFLDMGLSVLLYDYRGYGRSEGSVDEQGTYLDAEAAYDWLVTEGGLDPSKVVSYGNSLGGAVAIELATRRQVAVVFAESTFTSLPDIGARLYPWLPVRLLSRIRYDNLAKAPGLGVPVLLAHSPDDEVIPFEFGRRLFEAAREPKTFIELSGGHNDGGFALRPQWREEARAFLLRALSAG